MKAIILIFTSLLLTSNAQARVNSIWGVNIGNGGQIMSCPSGNWTFDLYEGRARGYSYPSINRDPLSYAVGLGAKVDAAIPERLRGVAARVSWVQRAMFFNKPGEILQFTGDTSETLKVEDGCTLIQTVVFRSSSDIEVSYDGWNSINSTNQAALYLHEAIYWYLRAGGVEGDSRRTRAAVSYLMAGKKLEVVDAAPVGSLGPIQHCHSERATEGAWQSEFYAYWDSKQRPTFQFISAGGYRMLTKTILNGTDVGDTNRPVIDRKGDSRKIVGALKSKLDSEAALSLRWGRSQILLTGKIQDEAVIKDQIVCEDYRP